LASAPPFVDESSLGDDIAETLIKSNKYEIVLEANAQAKLEFRSMDTEDWAKPKPYKGSSVLEQEGGGRSTSE
jgi:hypothetical protein